MQFTILDFQRRKANYTYLIQGEGRWSLLDLVPHMLEVSKHSRDYALEYGMGDGQFTIIDKRDREHRRARLRLEETLVPKINKVHVLDVGVGKQMIEKYLMAVEDSSS